MNTKQKNIHSIISFFCIVTMIFSIVFTTPAFAIEAQASEEYFTISNGEITAYTGTATDLTIPDTIDGQVVRAIGDRVFYKKGLNSVIIPNTVESIGKQAFCYNALTSIELPESLKNMGDGAFSSNKLSSVTIPKSLEKIPMVAFSKNQLTSVTIPEGVTSIGMGAFTVNKLESLVIPDSVTSIDKTAFKSNALKSVVISKNIKTIGISVFDTNQLESITIPEGVTNIDDAAFKNNKLQSLTIPQSVENIGASAFINNLLEAVTIPANVLTLNTIAFDSNVILTYSKLVDTIKYAESIETSGKPVENVQALTEAITAGKELNNKPNATLLEVNTSVENINNAINALDFTISEGEITAYTGTSKDVVIPDTINGQIVKAIGGSVFKKKELASVKIPDTVETIGYQSFNSNNLTSIELPKGLKLMLGGAFMGNKLTSVTIPEGLTSIPAGAFMMNQLTSVVIPEGVTNISAGAFNTNNLGPVTIPASVETLAANAFDKNTNIKLNYTLLIEAINKAEGISTIGKSAENVQALTSAIEEGKALNSKPKATLLEVNPVVLKINNAIKVLEEETAKPCINEIKPIEVIEVFLGAGEAEIKTKLPAMVTIIDSENTEHNVNVTWTLLSYNGNAAGEYTAEGTFELPEGIVQSNPAIELKTTVKIIVKSIDEKTWEIHDFTYLGTAITGLSESGKEKFKTNKDLILPKFNEFGKAITEIGDKAFLGDYRTKQDPNYGINSVIIPDTVTTIGEEAFRYNCLTAINIPNSVTTIKMSAFNGNKLKSLIIPDSVVNIEGGAFTLNELEYLKLPNGLTTVPTAFAFNNLTTVTIPEGVTRINDLAFSDNKLREVKLPSTLKYLSGLNNNEFTSITIPKSVTELGHKAFASNWMKSVTIPGNVKVIGERAFWNTWHDQYLESVIIEEGVERINSAAFSSNRIKEAELPSSLKVLSKDAFSTNLGYEGVVHLYTPNYQNPNNFTETNCQVINPAKLVIKYVIGDKVLKENVMWKDPTGLYFHIGDKDVQITPDYNDNENELEDMNPIRIDLNNKENTVIFQCKKKEVSDKLRIKSIGKVASIVVDYGTNKEAAMEKLAKKTFIVDTNNQMHEVGLTWTVREYNGNKAGEYTAVGTFKLPEGIAQSEPETKLEIGVQIIVKSSFENIDDSIWKAEDFTYDGTTITGFSETGMEKLKTNKDLVLPKVNTEGEDITRIGETAFKNMGLTSVVIPEIYGLVIEAGAFRENELSRVRIPEGVMEILTFAFYKNNLRYVDIPGTVWQVGNQAFAHNDLVSVTVAEGFGKICLDSFSFYDNQIASVTILKEVLKVHKDAFRDNLGHEDDNNKVYVYMVKVNSENNGLFELSNYHKVMLLAVESVEKLNPIEVAYGTGKNSITLPEKIKIKLNNGDVKEAYITWSNQNYNPNKAQEYTFKGYYDLPEFMGGEKAEVNVKVIVKAMLEENNHTAQTGTTQNKTTTSQVEKENIASAEEENIESTEEAALENSTEKEETGSTNTPETTANEKVKAAETNNGLYIAIFICIALGAVVIIVLVKKKQKLTGKSK